MSNNANIYRQRRAKRKRPDHLWFIPVLVVAAIIICVAVSASSSDADDAGGRIQLGPLSELELTSVPGRTPQIYKEYTGFSVSFNPEYHVPNYVSWVLTAERMNGTVERSNDFRPDSDVKGCATLDDYRRSGFDRGHMAPAGDMKWDEAAMSESHYLTNICPQTRRLNGGRWSTLEDKCREWVLRDSALVIVTGPVLSDVITRTIGKNQVAVPERFFKVILAPYANPPRAIGFIMPNVDDIEGLDNLYFTVDQVEEITGFDFFTALPDSIENAIEAHADFRDWNRRKR